MSRKAALKPAPIHVIAARQIDPDASRLSLDLPAGMTLREIVMAALPGAKAAELAQCRVALVSDRGQWIIPAENWGRIRPRPGIRIVIRVVPDKDALRAILSIVVTIAAFAAGQIWGAQFGAMLLPGAAAATQVAVGTAIVGVGVSIVGTLLVSALVPPIKPENRKAENRFSISGWKNPIDPNGAVPEIMGQLRVAPPFAALPYTEIVGDWQYVRALFCAGYGPLEIDDIRIGETSISEYSNLELEIRYGLPEELPVEMFPRQILEEGVGVELTRLLQRDENGNVIRGVISTRTERRRVSRDEWETVTINVMGDLPGPETPVTRTTGADASGATVILAFPAGLIRYNDEGQSEAESVSIRIEQRLITGEAWSEVVQLDMTARKLETFYREHSWSFPMRGRWQVRVTMLTVESTDAKRQRRVSWVGLQTVRPEYPLNFNKPLALVAVRVKATHQLSGSLDNLNFIARRRCLDWDHVSGTWVTRVTSNPASLYRLALQSPANPRPEADAGIDLEALQDWHDFCRLKNLKYDRELVDQNTLLRNVLAEIAAAGRASPRHDGLRWSVVIDRPDLPVIDHLNARNSSAHRSTRNYTRLPDAFRVPFLDATNDYKPAERFVPRPGFEGEPELTEELPMSGKTDPAEVYREGLRRWYEIMLRPDTYEVMQDAPFRVATRGDHIALSSPILDRVLDAARVRYVSGNLVELDSLVTMESGANYAIRFRVYDERPPHLPPDTLGRSVVRTVQTVAGDTRLITVTGPGDDMPQIGDILHFGPAGEESYRLLVTGIEAGEGMTSILRAVDSAPEIDTLTDAAEIPVWSGRVGSEIAPDTSVPAVPRFIGIASAGIDEENPGRISVLLAPGTGSVAATSYDLDHRPGTSGSWTTVPVPAANGGGVIEGYAIGDTVQICARAISAVHVASGYTAPATLIVGGDVDLPEVIDASAISITALPGGALIQLSTGDDTNTARIQIYRANWDLLYRETDAFGAPHPVAPLQPYSFTLGDTTRSNMISGGTMANPAAWTLEAGWAISGGLATHTPGSSDTISQPFAAETGKFYRLAYTITGRTVGSVTPRLVGGSPRPGQAATADGQHLDRIQAVSGNNRIEFLASSDFDGSITGVVAYLETAACLSQGEHFIWLEPQTAEGVPGPVSGPFPIIVI